MKTVLFQQVRSLLFFLSVFVVLFFSLDNVWAYSPTMAGGGEHTIALKADGTGFLDLNDDGNAELRIDSVSPLFGMSGQELQVTLTGAGFNENTRVSIAPDVTNKKHIIGSVDTPGLAYGVAVIGDNAYVADQCHSILFFLSLSFWNQYPNFLLNFFTLP